MVEKHVVSGLIEKRARVAGELSAAQIHVMRLKSDLAAIDCCLRMFKADFDPTTIAPKITLENLLPGCQRASERGRRLKSCERPGRR